MVDYNFEYQYKTYEQKPREYKISIKIHINNKRYQQQQIGFLRELFPNGINKQIKLNEEEQLELIEELLKQVRVN